MSKLLKAFLTFTILAISILCFTIPIWAVNGTVLNRRQYFTTSADLAFEDGSSGTPTSDGSFTVPSGAIVITYNGQELSRHSSWRAILQVYNRFLAGVPIKGITYDRNVSRDIKISVIGDPLPLESDIITSDPAKQEYLRFLIMENVNLTIEQNNSSGVVFLAQEDLMNSMSASAKMSNEMTIEFCTPAYYKDMNDDGTLSSEHKIEYGGTVNFVSANSKDFIVYGEDIPIRMKFASYNDIGTSFIANVNCNLTIDHGALNTKDALQPVFDISGSIKHSTSKMMINCKDGTAIRLRNTKQFLGDHKNIPASVIRVEQGIFNAADVYIECDQSNGLYFFDNAVRCVHGTLNTKGKLHLTNFNWWNYLPGDGYDSLETVTQNRPQNRYIVFHDNPDTGWGSNDKDSTYSLDINCEISGKGDTVIVVNTTGEYPITIKELYLNSPSLNDYFNKELLYVTRNDNDYQNRDSQIKINKITGGPLNDHRVNLYFDAENITYDFTLDNTAKTWFTFDPYWMWNITNFAPKEKKFYGGSGYGDVLSAGSYCNEVYSRRAYDTDLDDKAGVMPNSVLATWGKKNDPYIYTGEGYAVYCGDDYETQYSHTGYALGHYMDYNTTLYGAYHASAAMDRDDWKHSTYNAASFRILSNNIIDLKRPGAKSRVDIVKGKGGADWDLYGNNFYTNISFRVLESGSNMGLYSHSTNKGHLYFYDNDESYGVFSTSGVVNQSTSIGNLIIDNYDTSIGIYIGNNVQGSIHGVVWNQRVNLPHTPSGSNYTTSFGLKLDGTNNYTIDDFLINDNDYYYDGWDISGNNINLNISNVKFNPQSTNVMDFYLHGTGSTIHIGDGVYFDRTRIPTWTDLSSVQLYSTDDEGLHSGTVNGMTVEPDMNFRDTNKGDWLANLTNKDSKIYLMHTAGSATVATEAVGNLQVLYDNSGDYFAHADDACLYITKDEWCHGPVLNSKTGLTYDGVAASAAATLAYTNVKHTLLADNVHDTTDIQLMGGHTITSDGNNKYSWYVDKPIYLVNNTDMDKHTSDKLVTLENITLCYGGYKNQRYMDVVPYVFNCTAPLKMRNVDVLPRMIDENGDTHRIYINGTTTPWTLINTTYYVDIEDCNLVAGSYVDRLDPGANADATPVTLIRSHKTLDRQYVDIIKNTKFVNAINGIYNVGHDNKSIDYGSLIMEDVAFENVRMPITDTNYTNVEIRSCIHDMSYNTSPRILGSSFFKNMNSHVKGDSVIMDDITFKGTWDEPIIRPEYGDARDYELTNFRSSDLRGGIAINALFIFDEAVFRDISNFDFTNVNISGSLFGSDRWQKELELNNFNITNSELGGAIFYVGSPGASPYETITLNNFNADTVECEKVIWATGFTSTHYSTNLTYKQSELNDIRAREEMFKVPGTLNMSDVKITYSTGGQFIEAFHPVVNSCLLENLHFNDGPAVESEHNIEFSNCVLTDVDNGGSIFMQTKANALEARNNYVTNLTAKYYASVPTGNAYITNTHMANSKLNSIVEAKTIYDNGSAQSVYDRNTFSDFAYIPANNGGAVYTGAHFKYCDVKGIAEVPSDLLVTTTDAKYSNNTFRNYQFHLPSTTADTFKDIVIDLNYYATGNTYRGPGIIRIIGSNNITVNDNSSTIDGNISLNGPGFKYVGINLNFHPYISGNKVTNAVGLIDLQSPKLNFTNSVISSNNAGMNSLVYFYDYNTNNHTISNNEFNGNTCGDGIMLANSVGKITISDTEFNNNNVHQTLVTPLHGSNANKGVTVSGCEFKNNTGNAKLVSYDTASVVEIINSNFEDNDTRGLIYKYGNEDLTITNCKMYRNTINPNYSLIDIGNNTSLYISGSIIKDTVNSNAIINSSTDTDEVIIKNGNEFYNNHSVNGVIYLQDGTLTINNDNEFHDNPSSKYSYERLPYERYDLQISEKDDTYGTWNDALIKSYTIKKTKDIGLRVPALVSENQFISPTLDYSLAKYSNPAIVTDRYLDINIAKEGRVKVTGLDNQIQSVLQNTDYTATGAKSNGMSYAYYDNDNTGVTYFGYRDKAYYNDKAVKPAILCDTEEVFDKSIILKDINYGLALTDYEDEDSLEVRKEFAISFDKGGREVDANSMPPTLRNITDRKTMRIPLCIPTRSDETFKYWTDENKNIYYPGQYFIAKSNLHLTANWEDSVSESGTHTVTYRTLVNIDPNTLPYSHKDVAHNSKFTVNTSRIPRPVNEDLFFDCWTYQDPKTNETYYVNPGDEITVDRDIILTALFVGEGHESNMSPDPGGFYVPGDTVKEDPGHIDPGNDKEISGTIIVTGTTRPAYVVEIERTGEEFEHLQDAVDAAIPGDTLIIIENIFDTNEVKIDKNLKFSSRLIDYSGTSSTTGVVPVVNNTIIIPDGITINVINTIDFRAPVNIESTGQLRTSAAIYKEFGIQHRTTKALDETSAAIVVTNEADLGSNVLVKPYKTSNLKDYKDDPIIFIIDKEIEEVRLLRDYVLIPDDDFKQYPYWWKSEMVTGSGLGIRISNWKLYYVLTDAIGNEHEFDSGIVSIPPWNLKDAKIWMIDTNTAPSKEAEDIMYQDPLYTFEFWRERHTGYDLRASNKNMGLAGLQATQDMYLEPQYREADKLVISFEPAGIIGNDGSTIEWIDDDEELFRSYSVRLPGWITDADPGAVISQSYIYNLSTGANYVKSTPGLVFSHFLVDNTSNTYDKLKWPASPSADEINRWKNNNYSNIAPDNTSIVINGDVHLRAVFYKDRNQNGVPDIYETESTFVYDTERTYFLRKSGATGSYEMRYQSGGNITNWDSLERTFASNYYVDGGKINEHSFSLTSFETAITPPIVQVGDETVTQWLLLSTQNDEEPTIISADASISVSSLGTGPYTLVPYLSKKMNYISFSISPTNRQAFVGSDMEDGVPFPDSPDLKNPVIIGDDVWYIPLAKYEKTETGSVTQVHFDVNKIELNPSYDANYLFYEFSTPITITDPDGSTETKSKWSFAELTEHMVQVPIDNLGDGGSLNASGRVIICYKGTGSGKENVSLCKMPENGISIRIFYDKPYDSSSGSADEVYGGSSR